uniref:Neugrin n=1 Tax=Geotrypetes seraphini TaxID=260995 RepID=A0A6P8NI15_GEOSA|nr:neugrin [Geotrypetes seraphini]
MIHCHLLLNMVHPRPFRTHVSRQLPDQSGDSTNQIEKASHARFRFGLLRQNRMGGSDLFLRLGASFLSPWKKGILPAIRSVSALPPGGSRYLDDSEMDPEIEQDLDQDPESLALASVMKRQKKAILYQRLRREMEPRGPPERSLTWAAMDQIRQLNQEFPEEWTVHRLAEGFNVSSDVIKRVLRSKFSASPVRRMKQDAKATAKLEHKQLPQNAFRDPVQPKIQAGYQTRICLPSGKPYQQQKQISDGHTTTQGSMSPATLQVLPNTLPLAAAENNFKLKKQKWENQLRIDPRAKANLVHAASLSLTNKVSKTDQKLFISQEQIVPMEEEWDGKLPPEEELARIEKMGQENRMKVVQKGREFFDSDGNFLYRI